MSEQPAPFFLIIADYDQGFFSVAGPMTDGEPWQDGAMDARNNGQRIMCGPAGPDRDALAADYQRAYKLAGVDRRRRRARLAPLPGILRGEYPQPAYAAGLRGGVAGFMAWCDDNRVPSITAVQPLHVAAWIGQQTRALRPRPPKPRRRTNRPTIYRRVVALTDF
jgi:hypothetical protein